MDDRVESIIREWHERRPELDFSPLEVVARVILASHLLQDRLDRIAEAYGLSHTSISTFSPISTGPARLISEHRQSWPRLSSSPREA